MGALTRFVLATGTLTVPPAHAHAHAHAHDVDRWRSCIASASTRFGVPMRWIERVMRAESGGRTTLGGRPIRSRAGAIGLMQLMPETWAEMRARLGLGIDPDNPCDNILAGTLYLRLMYDRFGYPGLFAAYNAGPRRYAAYLAGRTALPRETIAYLDTVSGGDPLRLAPTALPPPPSLFAIRHAGSAGPEPTADGVSQPSLFAVRAVVP